MTTRKFPAYSPACFLKFHYQRLLWNQLWLCIPSVVMWPCLCKITVSEYCAFARKWKKAISLSCWSYRFIWYATRITHMVKKTKISSWFIFVVIMLVWIIPCVWNCNIQACSVVKYWKSDTSGMCHAIVLLWLKEVFHFVVVLPEVLQAHKIVFSFLG